MFTKRVKKTKQNLQKYILKLIDRKKKKLKNDNNKFIHFSYKDSLNNLNDIKDLNLNMNRNVVKEEKKNLLSIKKEKFEINTKEKNVQKIKIYYTLIKHLINIQTLMKLDNHSTR